jgi:hypothetical protein
MISGMEPFYTHDCTRCTFLGNYSETLTENNAIDPFTIKQFTRYFDLYCCEANGFYRSIIVRFGSQPEEYSSMPDYCIRDKFSSDFEMEPSLDERVFFEAYCRSLKVKHSWRIRKSMLMKKWGKCCRYQSFNERTKMVLVELLTLIDIAVYFGTLTFYKTSFHEKLLFSDFLEAE